MKKMAGAKKGVMKNHVSKWLFLLFAMGLLGVLQGCATPGKSTSFQKPSVSKQRELFSSRNIKPEGNAVLHYIDSRLYKLNEEDNLALEALKDSVESDPDSSFLHSELARYLAENNSFEQATLETEKALSLDPKNSSIHLLRGKLYSVKKDSVRATEEYDSCIKIDPMMEECYTMMTREYLLNKNYPKAIQTINRLLKADPQSTTGLYYLGSIYQSYAKDDKKAIAAFKNLLEEDPEDIKALAALGQIYLDEKNYPEAMKILLQIERLAPTDIPMKLRIGLLYYELKDYDKAIESFTQALQLSPDNDRVSYYLGLLEAQRKNYERALVHFKNVPTDSSLYKDAVLRTVLVYQELNQIDQAISYAKGIIEHTKDVPDLYDLLAALYSKQGNYKKAIETIDVGLKRFPEQEKLLFTKGVLLDKIGQTDKSLEIMQRILKADPQNALALNYIGYSYADKGINLQEALSMLVKANQIKPDDGYITDSLAWAYFRSGQRNKALELLQKANQLSPDEPTILEHLGDVYLDMGDKEKAKVYLQEAVIAAMKQENPEARDLEDLKRIRTKLGALNP
jgi:tetratricopeptide (TPR) repeat protein